MTERTHRQQHPQQSWLQRSIWQNGQIKNNTFKVLGAVFVFFALFALFGTALIFGLSAAFFVDDSELTFTSGMFNIIFQLAVLALIVFLFTQVIKAWRNWQRWKKCFLELQPMPAFLGGTLQGKLALPIDMDNESILRSTLGCYRDRRRSNKRLMFNKGIPIWESDVVKTPVIAGLKFITVQFYVPKSRPESNWTDPHDRVNWILTVKADNKNNIDFEVPVFSNPSEQQQ